MTGKSDVRCYVALACAAQGCLERGLAFVAVRGKEPPCRKCGGACDVKWGFAGGPYPAGVFEPNKGGCDEQAG